MYVFCWGQVVFPGAVPRQCRRGCRRVAGAVAGALLARLRVRCRRIEISISFRKIKVSGLGGKGRSPWGISPVGPWASLVLGRLGPGPGLVPGPAWSLVPGPWSMVRGPWSPVLVPGPWSLGPGPGLVPGPGPWSLVLVPWSLVPGPWSVVHGTGGPSEARVFHQSGPYESYGGVQTTIRRRISLGIFLDRSQVQLKPLLQQKSRKLVKIKKNGVHIA